MMGTENAICFVKPQSHVTSPPPRFQSICTRCGGLMVQEICIDLLNSTSELECNAQRCIQCGDIIDAVILKNRSLHQQSVTTQQPILSVH